jgi:hypothetical protein
MSFRKLEASGALKHAIQTWTMEKVVARHREVVNLGPTCHELTNHFYHDLPV